MSQGISVIVRAWVRWRARLDAWHFVCWLCMSLSMGFPVQGEGPKDDAQPPNYRWNVRIRLVTSVALINPISVRLVNFFLPVFQAVIRPMHVFSKTEDSTCCGRTLRQSEESFYPVVPECVIFPTMCCSVQDARKT